MHLYEDLADLGRSERLVSRIRTGQRVVNTRNRVQGIPARRGDGLFGEIVPDETTIFDPGYLVGRGPTATVEIGAEVKIVCAAMGRQVTRVINDLKDQVAQFQRGRGNPISVGVVGVNFAASYTSYEGDRVYPSTGRGKFKHPIQQAPEIERRLLADARPAYDHFLVLPFRATNTEPYPFEWVDTIRTRRDYSAMLVRISAQYDERF